MTRVRVKGFQIFTDRRGSNKGKSPHSAVTLCANSYGRPWTESGFRASWAAVRKKLEKAGRVGPGLTLYGLRRRGDP